MDLGFETISFSFPFAYTASKIKEAKIAQCSIARSQQLENIITQLTKSIYYQRRKRVENAERKKIRKLMQKKRNSFTHQPCDR